MLIQEGYCIKKLDACHSKGLKNMRRDLLSCFSNDKHVLNLKPSNFSKLNIRSKVTSHFFFPKSVSRQAAVYTCLFLLF